MSQLGMLDGDIQWSRKWTYCCSFSFLFVSGEICVLVIVQFPDFKDRIKVKLWMMCPIFSTQLFYMYIFGKLNSFNLSLFRVSSLCRVIGCLIQA